MMSGHCCYDIEAMRPLIRLEKPDLMNETIKTERIKSSRLLRVSYSWLWDSAHWFVKPFPSPGTNIFLNTQLRKL